MLSYANRFHGHNSVRFVLSRGQAVRMPNATLKYMENPKRRTSRAAVVVSKKVLKSAVARNRLRRRLYEIVRIRLAQLQKPTDIVILINTTETAALTGEELTSLIDQLFNQARLLK